MQSSRSPFAACSSQALQKMWEWIKPYDDMPRVEASIPDRSVTVAVIYGYPIVALLRKAEKGRTSPNPDVAMPWQPRPLLSGGQSA